MFENSAYLVKQCLKLFQTLGSEKKSFAQKFFLFFISGPICISLLKSPELGQKLSYVGILAIMEIWVGNILLLNFLAWKKYQAVPS